MSDVFKQIKEECLKSKETNPIKLLIEMMQKEYIHMHGPEHHVLDGACLLTALHNLGEEFDLNQALDEMIMRGSKMPGATCGQWGICGSASSLGAALATLHGTGPLSDSQYYKDNLEFTSQTLAKMAKIGGPRCCKRNAYLSILTMMEFMKEKYGIDFENEDVHCQFSHWNQQCMKERCPFYKKNGLAIS